MKSAYELAMERLAKQSPTVKLTDEQKRQLSELDALSRAKFAEREIFLRGQIEKAVEKGDAEEFQQLERQITADRRNLESECEEKKEKVRRGEAL